jgi:hypothetical protein
MSDMRRIIRPMRRNNIAQDAPGTILSRGSLLWYPPRFDHAQPRRRFSRVNVIETFARWKTVWTLWETAQTAVFHSAHTDHPFLQEEKEQRRTLQVCP